MKHCWYIALLILTGCTTDRTYDKGRWQEQGTAGWSMGPSLASTNPEGDGYLLTRGTYGDFELSVEFRPDADVNSGILIRCQDRENITPLTCLEINIWDNHPKPEFRTGAIVIHAAPPLVRLDTVNQWNGYRIVARGPDIEVWLNGELTARLTDAALVEGFIALQSQNGLISFRNFRIR